MPEPLMPWMLFGALFAGLPILIHILNKSRFDVVNWGAMMFLRKSLRVRSQRLKVQQVILLLLRCLFFAAIAVALSRPITKPENMGKEEQPTTHVLVVDGSYSMQQGKGKDQSFAKLKEEALHIVEGMTESDDMLIVWAGVKARPLFDKPVYDKDVLQRHIEDLEPGDEFMDLPRAFEKVFWLLQQSRQPRHRIYLLTDGQAHSWRDTRQDDWEQLEENFGLLKVAPTVYALAQKPEDPQKNLAINRIYPRSPIVDTFRQTTFLVEVLNHDKEPRTAKIAFYLNDRLMAQKSETVEPGSNTVDFTCRVDKPGANYLRAALGPDDINVDNHHILALHVMKQIPVLLLEGTSSQNPVESDGLVLSAALNAAARPGEANLIKVTQRNHLDVQDIDYDYLERFKCVVLANVPSLSSGIQSLLKHYVEKGGGLMICLGDEVDPETYNQMFSDEEDAVSLLPGKLEEVVEHEEGEDFFYPIFPAGTAAEVLSVFDLTRTRELKEVRMNAYWRVTPTDDALLVGRFENDPFILQQRVEEGHVILWTSSGNLDWTNFPVTPDYLPLLQDLVLYLSAGVQPPINLEQGETLLYSSERPLTGEEVDELAESAEEEESDEARKCVLTTPDGEEHTLDMVDTGREWIAQWDETLDPGLYTVRPEGAEDDDESRRFFAVNVHGTEGLLDGVKQKDENEISDRLPVTFVEERKELDELINEEIGVKEWWQGFVLLSILLLTTELVLGWKFNA